MAQTTAVVSLTWPEVLAWRLTRQHLSRRATRGEALGVVRRICGLHAQVMSSAELTLWARVEDLEADAVQKALWEERSLVKIWAMRGTLHLLPPAELPIWVGAQGVLKPRYHTPSWLRYFGLTREAAEYLVGSGAAFVGIDSLNIDDTDDGERPVHTALLGAEIPVCEHMTRLGALPDRGSRLFAVPVKVRGFGTLPVRAFGPV